MPSKLQAAHQRSATHWQRFSVPYEFPVVFTEGVFDPENSALRDVLCRLEPSKRHRAVFFVDDGLLAARPARLDEIARSAARRVRAQASTRSSVMRCRISASPTATTSRTSA